MWPWLAAVALGQTFTPEPDVHFSLGLHALSSTHDVGDVDGDGRPDVVWVQPGESLTVAFGQAGERLFQEPVALPLGAELPMGSTTVGDFDGDGIGDVAVIVSDQGAVRGWPGEAGGPKGPVWTAPGERIAIRAVGDLDQDGTDDLAVGTSLWLGSAAGWVPGPELPNAEGDSQLYGVGDVDGDGHADLAGPDVVSGSDWKSAGEAPLRFYRGTPDGASTTPLWSFDVPGTICGWALTVADLDADGARELVVACLDIADESASGSVVVLDDLADPVGPRVLTSTDVTVDLGGGFALGTLGDRDEDGAEELLVGFEGAVREVPWNDRVGLDFGAADVATWVHTQGGAISSLTTDDVDGDGTGDLVVSWSDEATDQQDVTIWLGAASESAGTPPGADSTEPDRGCGCATTSGEGSLVLLLGLLGLRRARRVG